MGEIYDNLVQFVQINLTDKPKKILVLMTGADVIVASSIINRELNDGSLIITKESLAIAHWYIKKFGDERKTTSDELCRLLSE